MIQPKQKKKQPKKKHQTGRKKPYPPKNTQGPQEGRRKGGKKREEMQWQKLKEKQEYILTLPTNTILNNTKKIFQKLYGFTANPDIPIWDNIPIALKNTPAHLIHQSPTNQHCHNLCKEAQPPPGFNYLLSLGLNFCIKMLHPKPNIQNTVDRITKSLRL